MNAHVQKTSAVGTHHYRDCGSVRSIVKPQGETFDLQRDQLLTLRVPRGWRAHALSGAAWITQAGDIRDIVLEAGETFEFDRSGEAFITPFGAARVCIAAGAQCRSQPSQPQQPTQPARAKSVGQTAAQPAAA